MRVFIGLDVSLAKTAICVVARDGEVLWQGVPSEPEPLVKRRAERSGAIDLAGIEACPLSEMATPRPRPRRGRPRSCRCRRTRQC
jgi:transposase